MVRWIRPIFTFTQDFKKSYKILCNSRGSLAFRSSKLCFDKMLRGPLIQLVITHSSSKWAFRLKTALSRKMVLQSNLPGMCTFTYLIGQRSTLLNGVPFLSGKRWARFDFFFAGGRCVFLPAPSAPLLRRQTGLIQMNDRAAFFWNLDQPNFSQRNRIVHQPPDIYHKNSKRASKQCSTEQTMRSGRNRDAENDHNLATETHLANLENRVSPAKNKR